MTPVPLDCKFSQQEYNARTNSQVRFRNTTYKSHRADGWAGYDSQRSGFVPGIDIFDADFTILLISGKEQPGDDVDWSCDGFVNTADKLADGPNEGTAKSCRQLYLPDHVSYFYMRAHFFIHSWRPGTIKPAYIRGTLYVSTHGIAVEFRLHIAHRPGPGIYQAGVGYKLGGGCQGCVFRDVLFQLCNTHDTRLW